MTADRDIARLIRAWLREDADESPDRVLDSVLDQIDWIPQRRPGWLARRSRIMNSNRFRFGIAAAAVVAVAFLGLRFLPSNVGGPEPEPIPETAFISERHHYALLFPDDTWTIIERPGEWVPGTTYSEGSLGIDVADRVGESEPFILLTSQPLDLDRDEWLARYDQLNAETFTHCTVESSESSTVDGEQARIDTHVCDGTWQAVEAVMFHADRAYSVRVFPRDDDDAFDPRPLLNEFLAIFRFLD